MDRAAQLADIRAMTLRHRNIHCQQNAGGRVDSHRSGNFVEWNLVEELLHVMDGGNRNAHLAHFPLCDGIVRIVTDLRWQIERDRQARLSLLEQIAITLIGFLRCGKARILTHGPEARAIHRRLDAARKRIFAGETYIFSNNLLAERSRSRSVVIKSRHCQTRQFDPGRGLEPFPAFFEFIQRFLESSFFPFVILLVDCHKFHHKVSQRVTKV